MNKSSLPQPPGYLFRGRATGRLRLYIQTAAELLSALRDISASVFINRLCVSLRAHCTGSIMQSFIEADDIRPCESFDDQGSYLKVFTRGMAGDIP